MIKLLLTRLVLPAGVVGLALGCAGLMVMAAPQAAERAPEELAFPVETRQVTFENAVPTWTGRGLVQAARQVALVPEVTGRVVRVHPNLEPGGRVKAGDALVELDRRDYALVVAQEEARLEQSKVEYLLEEGRKGVAEREWALLGDGRAADDVALALRAPQLQAAARARQSAESALERARLNLSRTSLRAPFDAVVLTESVDVGSYVGPTSVAAQLVASDSVWVKVSLPLDRVAQLQIKDESPDLTGSTATVRQVFPDGAAVERRGEVTRLLGELDPQTRSASVLVSVPDPFQRDPLPLLPGAYVEVELEGRPFSSVAEVPRSALQDNDRVWVVVDGRLVSRQVQVVWRNDQSVLVKSGLEEGDLLVTSPLSLPVEGMPVRLTSDPAALPAEKE